MSDNFTSDKSIDTVVSIGIMGSGKSSLSNILALQDNQVEIPVRVKD